jgi:hypothetical protein
MAQLRRSGRTKSRRNTIGRIKVARYDPPCAEVSETVQCVSRFCAALRTGQLLEKSVAPARFEKCADRGFFGGVQWHAADSIPGAGTSETSGAFPGYCLGCGCSPHASTACLMFQSERRPRYNTPSRIFSAVPIFCISQPVEVTCAISRSLQPLALPHARLDVGCGHRVCRTGE